MTDIISKCSSCNSYFNPTVKSSGLLYKSCDRCRSRFQQYDKGRIDIKCPHFRRKRDCRECGNVIKLIITRFMSSSKLSDKRHNLLDIANFIDRDFCKLLIEECNGKCCYCECELEYIHNCNNMITIERIDNTIGHNKSNVKIACFHCNVSRVGSS